jgi:hypothetical protein
VSDETLQTRFVPQGELSVLANGIEITAPNATTNLTDHLIEQRVSGVFFAPLEFADDHEEVNRNIAGRFFQAGISVVLLDRDWAPFPAGATSMSLE